MKPLHSFAMLAAIAAVGQAFAADAVTTPVGYVTETLASGQFNLVGVTVHNPVLAAGVLTSADADSVEASSSDFGALLESGATYILEVEGGVIQEITAWSGSSLTTPDDVSGFITTGETTFKIRKASTISDIFGAENSAGLLPTDSFDPSQSDIVLVPSSGGGFDSFFYSTFDGAEGWFNAGDFSPAANAPVVYTDSLLVQVRGSSLDLTISGEVKKDATSVFLGGGQFNYVGGIYPVGTTLMGSGLSATLQPTDAFDPSLADLVLVPIPGGGFNQYFYSSFDGAEGWFNAGDFAPSNDEALSSGLIVLRRGSDIDALISPPSSYATL
jgi:hypothetical protein